MLHPTFIYALFYVKSLSLDHFVLEGVYTVTSVGRAHYLMKDNRHWDKDVSRD